VDIGQWTSDERARWERLTPEQRAFVAAKEPLEPGERALLVALAELEIPYLIVGLGAAVMQGARLPALKATVAVQHDEDR
jgi:hypothetical protein